MQFELTSDYLNQLKDAVEGKDATFLKEQLHELYPQDIAIIINNLNLEEAAYMSCWKTILRPTCCWSWMTISVKTC